MVRHTYLELSLLYIRESQYLVLPTNPEVFFNISRFQ